MKQSSRRFDLTVVGAGILGLAHAWSAAERGLRVLVIERSARPEGASVRNFGMVWPVGQPAGEYLTLALESAARWRRIGTLADLRVEACGSIHLAHREDEWTVLSEFQERSAELGYRTRLLTPKEVRERSPGAREQGLLGGLLSNSELSVDPPAAVRGLAAWLARAKGVEFQWETHVRGVDGSSVRLADGTKVESRRTVICCGAELGLLFPGAFRDSGLRPCKLRMLRTQSQPAGWHLGTHLASGLTLRHYASFEVCPSLPALRARVARESPELDDLGIHVMASQGADGSVILGDSHEYDTFEPFDETEIEQLLMRELTRVFDLPNWELAARWHGIYAKDGNGPQFAAEPLERVHLRTGLGGSGMTMAFGLAERDWRIWDNEP